MADELNLPGDKEIQYLHHFASLGAKEGALTGNSDLRKAIMLSLTALSEARDDGKMAWAAVRIANEDKREIKAQLEEENERLREVVLFWEYPMVGGNLIKEDIPYKDVRKLFDQLGDALKKDNIPSET